MSWRLEGAEVSGLLQERRFGGMNNRRVDIAVAAVLTVKLSKVSLWTVHMAGSADGGMSLDVCHALLPTYDSRPVLC